MFLFSQTTCDYWASFWLQITYIIDILKNWLVTSNNVCVFKSGSKKMYSYVFIVSILSLDELEVNLAWNKSDLINKSELKNYFSSVGILYLS